MTEEILHSRPWIRERDYSAVADILRSGMLAQGDAVKHFEASFADWVGVPEPGVATSCGAAAIVLAFRALGMRGGDEVILPSYICPKVLEAVLAVDAVPKLCDIGEQWMVEPRHVEKLVNDHTRALLIPHLNGIFTDIEPFKQFGIPIVEDCAQAIDAKGKHQVLGDIAIFSFHPTKALTTAEGGMAISRNPTLVAAMRAERDGSGDTPRTRYFAPLTDFQAALGLSQLAGYSEALERRRSIAQRYRDALNPVLGKAFGQVPWQRSMFFRFVFSLNGGIAKYRPLFAKLQIRVSNAGDTLLHRKFSFSDSAFPGSVYLYNSTISIPIYPALSEIEVEKCIGAAERIFSSET